MKLALLILALIVFIAVAAGGILLMFYVVNTGSSLSFSFDTRELVAIIFTFLFAVVVAMVLLMERMEKKL